MRDLFYDSAARGRNDQTGTTVSITTYLDESGTHNSSPFVIMGGVVGRSAQWVDYNKKWDRLLKKNLLTYFHSRKLRATSGEFASWSEQSKRLLIRDIDKLQNRNTLFRFVTVVRKDEFQQFYKGGERPKKLQLDSIYGLCFRLSLSFAVELVERSFGLIGQEINFIVEAGHHNAGSCQTIFNQIKKHVPELSDVLGACTVEDKRKLPGLQGADAVSYAGYQQEKSGDEADLMDFAPNWNLESAKTILKAGSPVFRSYARPEILSELKEKLFALEERRRQVGRRTTA